MAQNYGKKMTNKGYLTTHILDMARGVPASLVKIELYSIERERKLLASAITNEDGRCNKPLLEGNNFKAGAYELLFYAGKYFREKNIEQKNGQFLEIIPVHFIIVDENAHYHVPLLLSPYGYSTYRGS